MKNKGQSLNKLVSASVALAAVSLIAVNEASAFDACGHKTVAAIAWSELKPGTQVKIKAVFAADPRGRQFIDAASWPDDIKMGLRNNVVPKAELDKSWHFVDIPYDAQAKDVDTVLVNRGIKPQIGKADSANVVTAIEFYRDQLKTGQGDAIAQADALSWLIHLVGDVHQPLHCVTVTGGLTNYVPPVKGDEGGNGFSIRHPSRELHALWDDLLDEPKGGRHDEGRNSSDDNAIVLAGNLTEAIHPAAEERAVADPAVWARESYGFRTFVYDLPLDQGASGKNQIHGVSTEYLEEARDIGERRIVLAGERLAILLESIYGSK